MGIFSKRQKPARPTEKRFSTLTTPSFASLITRGHENTTALACQSLIANAVSTLPISLYFRSNTGHIKGYNHWAYNLVKRRPNIEEPPQVFYNRLVRDVLSGNAYIYKTYKGTEVISLNLIDPSIVEVYRDDGHLKQFKVNGLPIDRKNIIHIPGIYYNGLKGISVLDYASKALEVSQSLDEYAIAGFGNSIDNRLVVDISEGYPDADPDDVSEISEYLRKNYAGEANKGKPLILHNKLKASMLDKKNGDFANTLADNKELQRVIIAELYNVPLSLLGGSKNNAKSLEQENQYFLQYTLSPYLQRIEQYLSLGLLSPYEGERYYCKFSTDGFLRLNQKERMESYVRGLSNGIYTLNEVRGLEDLSSISEDIGEVRFMPANFMPLTKDVIDAYMASAKEKQIKIEQGIGDDKK